MDTARPIPPSPATTAPAQPRNGFGVAALVLGVASLVAAISFLLFPLALIGGIVGAILGAVALSRQRAGLATNRGQALAGLICSLLALALAIVWSVRVGTWAANNRGPIVRLESCLARAGSDDTVRSCFGRFVTEFRD
jgi:membrane-bound ClpP family serine protease